MAVRPIIETKVMTEFGEVLEDAEFYAESGANGDKTYVPGYSDMRRARDAQMAEVQRRFAKADSDAEIAARNRALREIAPLPVRLQWVRATRVSGEPDSTKEVQYGDDGYRAATKADIGQEWLKALPGGAKFVPGGSIRKGDLQLMVCDAPRAARNALRVRRMTEQQSGIAASKLMAEGQRVKGSDPTFESKLADKPLGQE